ncbi:MAG TPA: CHRD domain-containing protein [Solirubrobacteraceae bacterium]|jgi:hypothetical protein|nr:CHRD domain-containing protein [Solirubrobacteraceae bacterium]
MGKLKSRALAVTAGVLVAVGSTAAVAATTTTYTVHLTGSQEIPKHSTGKGTFHYQLVTASGKLCYSLTWSGIGTPFAAHVHKGKKGVEGPVVIALSASAPVKHSGCVKVKKALLLAIKKAPSAYYVNVHNKKYPNGAIRGQLP